MASSHNRPLTDKYTVCATRTDGEDWTGQDSEAYAVAIEQKLTYVLGETSVKAEAHQAKSTSQAVSTEMSMTSCVEREKTCGGDSPSGLYYLWRYKIHQKDERGRPGFDLASGHFLCTFEAEPPLCPVGLCANPACTVCYDDFEVPDGAEGAAVAFMPL